MCNRVLLLFGKLPQWNLQVNCHVNGKTIQSSLRFQNGLSSFRVSCKRALIQGTYFLYFLSGTTHLHIQNFLFLLIQKYSSLYCFGFVFHNLVHWKGLGLKKTKIKLILFLIIIHRLSLDDSMKNSRHNWNRNWNMNCVSYKSNENKKIKHIKSHQFHGPDGDGNMPNKTK